MMGVQGEYPPRPKARLERSLDEEAFPLSEPLLTATFEAGVWYRINEVTDSLIDEYEEEEIPVEKLQRVVDELHAFAADPRGERVRDELLAAAAFLEAARQRHSNVWVIL